MSCIPINDFSLITLCDATKAGKLYSIVPDSGAGDLDVVRASTATYLGADGLIKTAANNEPRIEFNADGSYKGLLVEPAATKLVLRSQEFDNAAWNKVNSSVTANDAVAPDGTTTADKLVENAGTGSKTLDKPNISVSSGAIYTVSFFAKKSQRHFLQISMFAPEFGINAFGNFNLALGVLGSLGSDSTATIRDFGNGWFLCSLTSTAITSSSTSGFSARLVTSATSVRAESYTGDGTSGFFIWGAQIEESPVATSYIPTVASTVTRAADVITKTGISSLIGQTEGTVYAEVVVNDLSSQLYSLYQGVNNEIRVIVASTGILTAQYRDGVGTGQIVLSPSLTFPFTAKIVQTYQDNTTDGHKLYVNGVLVGTANTGAMPNPIADIFVGRRGNNTSFANAHIKAFALLPTALTDEQAIQLTS